MKHILMACGTGICTSSCVRARVEEFLDVQGYAGKYNVAQTRMADVPRLQADYDFLIATTLIPGTLDIPYINGIPFLTGHDMEASKAELLKMMEA